MEQQGPPSEEPAEAETEPLEQSCVHGLSTLAHALQGQNLQFCIWMPVLFDPVINAQEGKIPSIMIAADDTVIDRTVRTEHLLLQSHPKCFISHSPTYLILSITKYHLY